MVGNRMGALRPRAHSDSLGDAFETLQGGALQGSRRLRALVGLCGAPAGMMMWLPGRGDGRMTVRVGRQL